MKSLSNRPMYIYSSSTPCVGEDSEFCWAASVEEGEIGGWNLESQIARDWRFPE